MELLTDLLEKVSRLSDSARNQELQTLWQGELSPTYDSADFFRGIPAPGMILCLAYLRHGEWGSILPGYELHRYYTDPEYYLEFYLRKYIYYFEELQDDRPIPKSIPIFQTTLELSLFGAETRYFRERNPWISGPVIRDPGDLDRMDYPDFYTSGLMPLVHDFYGRIQEIVGHEFHVTFPCWRLGLFGTALHLRGIEDFLTDLLLNPDFAHRLMAFVTESRRRWEKQRAEFLGEPISKAHLGNDDVNVPFLSPRLYAEFVLPYEQELVRYAGGLRYWHSCGNVTRLLPLMRKLGPIDLIELSYATDLGKLIDTFPGTPLEIYVHPKDGMSTDAVYIKQKITAILETCRRHGADTVCITGGRGYWFQIASQVIREYKESGQYMGRGVLRQ